MSAIAGCQTPRVPSLCRGTVGWSRSGSPIKVNKRFQVQIQGALLPPIPLEAPPPEPPLRVPLKPAKASEVLYTEKLSYERKAACKKWVAIIAVCSSVWQIAQFGFGAPALRYAQGGLVEHVKDALASRATSTLHTRAGPMLRYIQFSVQEGLTPFP